MKLEIVENHYIKSENEIEALFEAVKIFFSDSNVLKEDFIFEEDKEYYIKNNLRNDVSKAFTKEKMFIKKDYIFIVNKINNLIYNVIVLK